MGKEFGKLSAAQLQAVVEILDTIPDQVAEFQACWQEKEPKVTPHPWGNLYELQAKTVIAATLVWMGVGEFILAAAKASDPQAVAIRWAQNPPDPPEWEAEELSVLLMLLFAAYGNLECMKQYSVPMDTLVQRVEDGDDHALFQAVSVDRAVVQSTPVAKRICRAQCAADKKFMRKLGSVFAGRWKGRPAPKLDDFRFMVEVLEEAAGLSHFTQEELYKVFVEWLEVYPSSGKDPFEGMRKALQVIKLNAGR